MKLAPIILLIALTALGQTVNYREMSAPDARVVEAPIQFTALGSKWSAGSSQGLRVRTSADGRNWSEWQRVSSGPDAGNEPQGALIFFDLPQRFVEYEVERPLTGLRFAFIDPGETPSVQLEKLRQQRREEAPSKPQVISRVDWGCPDGENFRGTPQYTTVTHLIVHHTGDSFPSKDYAAWVRAIWAYHVFSNGWADIGYNYVVDPDGNIYEGRAGGDNVLGAHFSCQNGGTMGVSLLGTFTSSIPTDAALKSLYALLAWRAGALGIDPVGQTFHQGTNQMMYNISGHRDGNPSPFACSTTECPGNLFYPMLPSVRSETAKLLGTGFLLYQDGEHSTDGWTTSGLWHLAARRSNSVSHAFWYGRDETGDYDTGTANSGTLESPVFTVQSDATLTFRSWTVTENSGTEYDRMYVEASVDGGEWRTLLQLSGPQGQWNTFSAPLTMRGNVRVRFRFDTVDGAFNHYEGWYVDDISVK